MQAVVQQTPCSQLRDWHSGSAEQKAPTGLRPHELLVQTLPDEQLALPVQAWKHRVFPSHTKGAQAMASGAMQFPLASQVEAGV